MEQPYLILYIGGHMQTPPWRLGIVLIGLVLIIGIMGSHRPSTPPSSPPHKAYPLVSDWPTCVLRGGQWHRGFVRDYCALPTHDGGRSCSDTRDCDGVCLAPEGRSTPLVSTTSVSPHPLIGICSAYDDIRGCHTHIQNGALVQVCRD